MAVRLAAILLLACSTIGCDGDVGPAPALGTEIVAPPGPGEVIGFARGEVHRAEETGWNESVANVRTRIDSLTAVSGVLLRSMAIAEGRDDEPREVARLFRPAPIAYGEITVQSPSGMPSQSVGRPNRGWLVNGASMPDGPYWTIRRRREAYGTDFAVSELVGALMHVGESYPGTPRIGVFDWSHSTGGPSPPHVSHQSGRDVDIAFYMDPPGESETRFEEATLATLDVERQWEQFRYWIERDVVTYIFVDRSFIPALYRHARTRGEPPELIQRAFASPTSVRDGIIRHEPGHDDHVHVRFRCAPLDGGCVP